MNLEEVIAVAKEAGIENDGWGYAPPELFQLERFASLIAAREREECAKVCEAEKVSANKETGEDHRAFNIGVRCCAAAIRARAGNEPKHARGEG